MWNRGAAYRGPTISYTWILNCAEGECPNLQSVFKDQQYFLLVCGLSLHPLIRVFHRSNILNFVEVQFIDFLFFFSFGIRLLVASLNSLLSLGS